MSSLLDLEFRLSSKIEPEPMSGCWLWTAYLDAGGYGQVRFGGRTVAAHRAIYMVLIGEIPEGLQIDHLCRNRACVNPAHLEVVTPQVNVARGESPNAVTHRTGWCVRGHKVVTGQCKPCQRDAQRRWNSRWRAAE